MRKNKAILIEIEKVRSRNLDALIDDLFAEKSPGDLEEDSRQFQKVTTSMIEVVEVTMDKARVLDIDADSELNEVIFPVDLHVLLRAKDVFLATLGYCGDHWHVLWLSRRYEPEEWQNSPLETPNQHDQDAHEFGEIIYRDGTCVITRLPDGQLRAAIRLTQQGADDFERVRELLSETLGRRASNEEVLERVLDDFIQSHEQVDSAKV